MNSTENITKNRRIIKKTCEVCQAEFTAKSEKARFCCNACRQKAYMLWIGQTVQEDSVYQKLIDAADEIAKLKSQLKQSLKNLDSTIAENQNLKQ